MARILVISTRLPTNLADGLDLRVHHLCRELAIRNECFFVGPLPSGGQDVDISTYGFSDSRFLAPRPRSGRSWRRHFRLSNENFLEISSPAYFSEARAIVKEAVATWGAEVAICFAPVLSELGLQVGIPKIVDFVDSRTLTAERARKNRRQDRGVTDTVVSALRSRRDAARERFLVRNYDLTMTISEPDREALLRVSRVGDGASARRAAKPTRLLFCRMVCPSWHWPPVVMSKGTTDPLFSGAISIFRRTGRQLNTFSMKYICRSLPIRISTGISSAAERATNCSARSGIHAYIFMVSSMICFASRQAEAR